MDHFQISRARLVLASARARARDRWRALAAPASTGAPLRRPPGVHRHGYGHSPHPCCNLPTFNPPSSELPFFRSRAHALSVLFSNDHTVTTSPAPPLRHC